NGLVHAAQVLQRGGSGDPKSAGERAGGDRQYRPDRGWGAGERDAGQHGAEPAQDDGSLAADDEQAHARWNERAERGQQQRGGLGERILDGKARAEAAQIERLIHRQRIVALEGDEAAEQDRRNRERSEREQQGFQAIGRHTPRGEAPAQRRGGARASGGPISLFRASYRGSSLQPGGTDGTFD